MCIGFLYVSIGFFYVSIGFLYVSVGFTLVCAAYALLESLKSRGRRRTPEQKLWKGASHHRAIECS